MLNAAEFAGRFPHPQIRSGTGSCLLDAAAKENKESVDVLLLIKSVRRTWRITAEDAERSGSKDTSLC